MEPAKSHAWKPLVYLGLTTGGVIVVLGALVLTLRVITPEFSLSKALREDGEATLWIAGSIAYVTVLGITALLRRHYGREFGTYLDDPDLIEAGPGPSEEKLCPRCGTRFGVYRNDFHAAGFCSRACRNAFARRS
jgi:hypothetical protein